MGVPERGYTCKNEVIVMNKRSMLSVFSAALIFSFTATAQIVDVYSFRMLLYVPRIYNNMESMGYRKYQLQTISGQLMLIYTDSGETVVKVNGLENRTHKLNGRPVTYTCYDWPYDDNGVLVVGVGNNKTLRFTQGGASFSFVAEPSYNVGAVDEDNTLMLELSGRGSIRGDVLRNLSGSVCGNIGCGCKAYGHVSPTRLFLGGISNVVWDVAPLYGRFNARFKRRFVGPVDVDNL